MEDDELRPSSLFDTVGKALGSLAGLAIFVYVVGGLTVLARLQRVHIPPEVVIPRIPRERLALIGLAQLLWTLVLGGLVAALAIWLLPDREPEETWGDWWAWVRGHDKWKWIPAVFVVVAIVLIAPLSANGLAYVAILLLGVSLFLAARQGALRRLAVALFVWRDPGRRQRLGSGATLPRGRRRQLSRRRRCSSSRAQACAVPPRPLATTQGGSEAAIRSECRSAWKANLGQ